MKSITTVLGYLGISRRLLTCQCRRYSGINNAIDAQNGEGDITDVKDSGLESQMAEDLLGAFEPKAKIDPDKTCALLFPGQGSQYVGMAKNYLQYPNVADMFEVASEILGFNLLNLCLTGPKTELDRTVHCQPAVVVTALAGVEKLLAESPEVLENCYMTAGYSVGEYAALVFSQALSFEDAIELVKVRATEMQKASDEIGGGMITAIGGAQTKFNAACTEAVEYCQETLNMDGVICKVAGHLAPNVRTIAGHRVALEYLMANKQNYFIKRAKILPVSGGFHSTLMYPAVAKLRSVLTSIHVENPIIKVYSNIDGKPYRGPKDIVNKLPKQVIQPVRWEQTMHTLLSRPRGDRMPHIYELGPGCQLGALLRKCNGKAWLKYLAVDDTEHNASK